MPRFSIIVPVYNVQNYLAACVKSVAEQAGERDWECILVDDGSTDLSGQLCDALAAEIPGLRVIHRENGGLAAARNTGLQAAQGDWLLFLDSDDAMAPGLLEALRAALPAHPGYDWFIGRHLEWQPDGSLTEHTGLHLVPGPFDSTDYAARLKALYNAGHWSVWKYCIRRSFLQKTGVRFLPDCCWAEDWPFDLELLLHCERLYFLDVVFTHYRVGRQGSLLTDAKNLPKRFRAYGEKAFYGTCDKYLGVNDKGELQLSGICLVAGLGGATRRDGSLEYYFSEPVVENDAKGVAPLLLAYTEMIIQ